MQWNAMDIWSLTYFIIPRIAQTTMPPKDHLYKLDSEASRYQELAIPETHIDFRKSDWFLICLQGFLFFCDLLACIGAAPCHQDGFLMNTRVAFEASRDVCDIQLHPAGQFRMDLCRILSMELRLMASWNTADCFTQRINSTVKQHEAAKLCESPVFDAVRARGPGEISIFILLLMLM